MLKTVLWLVAALALATMVAAGLRAYGTGLVGSGYSAEIRPESLARYRFPDGEEWRGVADDISAAGIASATAGASR